MIYNLKKSAMPLGENPRNRFRPHKVKKASDKKVRGVRE
jgi:hypothetical protein